MLPPSITWLNAEFVQKLLKSSENDDSLEVKDVAMQSATATGDNYLSDMIRVKVEYSRHSSVCKATENKSIIIKVAPTTGASKDVVRKYFYIHSNYLLGSASPDQFQLLLFFINLGITKVSELGVFDTEIKMMENTLVKMNEMLEDEGHRLSARVLCTEIGDPTFIVIEDVAPLGYRMADRQAGLDLEHCILAMRGLARFHATSVAVLEKEPKAMATYNRHIFDRDYKALSNIFPNGFKKVAKELLNWSELGTSRRVYSDKFAKLSDTYIERFKACTTPKTDEFNVLNHGDCWINNMLFRYDDKGKVIDHIFVDFQLCIVSSPALDILNFTNTSLSEDVELHHRDTLLEEYLNVLTRTMTRLNCNTKAPDMAGLKTILQQYEFLAVISSCIALPFILIDKSEAKSIDEIVQAGEDYVNPGYKGPTYRKRMLSRLPAWIASGVLDS